MQLRDQPVHFVDYKTRLDPFHPSLLQNHLRLYPHGVLCNHIIRHMTCLWTHPFHSIHHHQGTITQPHSRRHLSMEWGWSYRHQSIAYTYTHTSLEKSTCPGESIRFTKYVSSPSNKVIPMMSHQGPRICTSIVVQSDGAGFHSDASQLLVLSAVHVPELHSTATMRAGPGTANHASAHLSLRNNYLNTHNTFPACLWEMMPLLATKESARDVLPVCIIIRHSQNNQQQ